MINKIKWQEIFLENKRLDAVFYDKYQNDVDLYRKNCIELLVEIGEFVNETKVFKYWSIKKPDKEKVLDEFADTITMCLYFMREFKMELDDRYPHSSGDILDIINDLYAKTTLLMQNNQDIIKDIFGNLLYLGERLDFKEEEILDAIRKKHKIIEERLKSNLKN